MIRTKIRSTPRPRISNRPRSLRALNTDIDPTFYYTDPLTRKTYPAWMVSAVDELLYKVRHQNIWKIVDFCLSIWAKKWPIEYKAFLKEQEVYRKKRRNKFASTKSKWMRELVNVPRELTYLLNKIASHKIQDYGEHKFWRDFSKRYPGFRNYDTF